MEEYFIEEGYGKNRRMRPAVKLVCPVCGKEFLKAKHNYKEGSVPYCSKECAQKVRQNRDKLTCAYCGKTFYRKKSSNKNSKSGLQFCCRECKDKAQSIYSINGNMEKFKNMLPKHYGNGLATKNFDYRKFIFGLKPMVCERCGYSENVAALQIHHKDHNRSNNAIENLEVLCANCHCIEHFGK